MGYGEWVAAYDVPAPSAGASEAGSSWRPLVHVRVGDTTSAAGALTLESLHAQHYTRWLADDASRVVVARGADAPDGAHAESSVEPTLETTLRAGDRLAPHALHAVVAAFAAHPDARVVYTDDDEWPRGGVRTRPRFKPDFDLDLLCATNYVHGLVVFRRVDPAPAAVDDLLRVVSEVGDDAVVHVPRVLLHRRDTRSPDASVNAEALERLIARRHPGATVLPATNGHTARVRYPLPSPLPRVTLVMPTRNQASRLRTAVDTIQQVTSYPSFEWLVVDNGSDDAECTAYLRALASEPGVRVLRDERAFNWSALNNAAAVQASGDLFCFINDDVEAIEPDWLTELVRVAMRADVGVAGARLWYPDGTLQHGGLVLHPHSGASHLEAHLPREACGYLGLTHSARRVSAVTGACLVVRREVFQTVGGFDEALPSDFNDVDFCLRVGQRGLKTVYTPFANLVHHEGATRGGWDDPAHRRRFTEARRLFADRWGPQLAHDPWFNPNLSISREDPPLAWPPRLEPRT